MTTFHWNPDCCSIFYFSVRSRTKFSSYWTFASSQLVWGFEHYFRPPLFGGWLMIPIHLTWIPSPLHHSTNGKSLCHLSSNNCERENWVKRTRHPSLLGCFSLRKIISPSVRVAGAVTWRFWGVPWWTLEFGFTTDVPKLGTAWIIMIDLWTDSQTIGAAAKITKRTW